MQEAYRVGIAIALSGDVGTIISKLVEDFERLDRAVGGSQEGMGSLTNALKGMAAEGKAAADSWQNVAKAIQASAKAARDAAAAGAAMRESASRQAATSYAQDAINAANAANQSRRGSPDNMLVPVYQQRGRYGDQSSGPTMALPYENSRRDLVPSGAAAPRIYTSQPDPLEGDIILPSGRRALPPGANPYGPTINGSWTRPSGSGPTYGPYGPRAAGGTPAVPGGGNGGMMPPGSGGPGGPGGGMPPLNYPYWANHFGPTNWGQEWHDFHSQFNGMAMLSDIAGVAWMKSNFDRGAEFAQEQSHLAAQGFTPKEVQQAGDTALQVSRDVAGMTPMNALHLINKLMNVTQDKNVALDPKLLEAYSKASVVLSTYGHGNELHEIDAAVRAGEFRGALTHEGKDGKQEINVQGLSEFLSRLTAMSVASGGDIGPSRVLQYLRSSGAAGSIISEEELTKTMALQIAMGQSKAGSALKGFEQQFTAGRMSEAAANLLLEMGIIKGGGDAKHNPYLTKMGPGQFMMRPGAMPAGMQEQAAINPSVFIMDQLLPRFREMITKVYGDRYTHGDEKTRLMYEVAMAQQVASRIPGGTQIAEVIRNILLMNRDVAAAEAALKRDQYKNAIDTNPLLQVRALIASYQGFQTVLGKDTIPLAANGLQGLAGGLNDLTIWAQAHSAETKLGLEALAGALIALGGVGIIAIAGTLGGLTGGLLALGAAVGPAAMGIEALGDKITKLLTPLERPMAHVGAALAFKPYVDPTTIDPNKVAPGALIPWWMPLPAVGSATREPAPSWVPNFWSELGMASAHGATPSTASGMRTAAAPPAASMLAGGPKGTANDPLHAIVQNQPSGADIARGVSSYQASKANRPPSGYTGTDTRIDAMGYFYGMVNSPN